jgi:peptide/nickel transport system ATP-binding protein
MSAAPALEIDGLCVVADGHYLVRDACLSLRVGGILVILGESGSGKSLLAHAVMGTLPPELEWRGRIAIGGMDFGALDAKRRRAHWGRAIALLPQEPWASLDPLMRVQDQIAEVHALVGRRTWREAGMLAERALATLGLGAAGKRYPFQLSGGMAQRAAVAVALAGGARLLVADEPTKGLDADRRDDVAELLISQARTGAALIVITHDIALARKLGGSMAVMLAAQIVEQGATADILAAPRHAYTMRLLAADPAGWKPALPPAVGEHPVVEARNLAVERGGKCLFSGLDVEVCPGEIVAATGPSGCGKTSLGNALLGLLAPQIGSVRRASASCAYRFQKLYQDPVSAFAAGSTLGVALDDVCRRHGLPLDAPSRLLARLRIRPELLARRPDQVSGGELQRVALARALLVDPAFLFADEPTSRLDPIIQQEVMALLREVVAERHLAMLLVTHDGALAAGMTAKAVRVDAHVGAGPMVAAL